MFTTAFFFILMACFFRDLQEAAADILVALENLVELHFHNPTLPLDDTFKVMRQAAYKKRHGQKRARAAERPWSERKCPGHGQDSDACLASCEWTAKGSVRTAACSPGDDGALSLSPATPQDRADPSAAPWSQQNNYSKGGQTQKAASMSPLALTPLALALDLPVPEVSPGLFCRLLEQEPLEHLLEDSCDSS